MTTQQVLLTQTLKGVPPVVYAVQNDTGRVLQMTIDNGLPVDLTGATAELTFIRSDGTSYGVPCTTDQSIESTFNANIEQAITQPGPTKCQLKVSKNGELVSTFHFVIIVESDTSGTPTEQQSWNIEEAIAAAAEAKATADQVLEELGPISQIDERLTDVEEELPQKANTDGAYEQMTVGNAEQLVSTTFVEDKVPYLFRTSGGSSDIGDREYDKIVGGTVVWNQLVDIGSTSRSKTQNGVTITDNRDGSYTIQTDAGGATAIVSTIIQQDASTIAVVKDHKFLFNGFGTTSQTTYRFADQFHGVLSYLDGKNSGISNARGNGRLDLRLLVLSGAIITTPITVKPTLIDLTAMFGSTIADYLYSLEQSTPGAGIAKVKEWGFFGEDYYEYDPGTNKSVEGLVSHDMVGFNQWDEEWELGSYDISGNKTASTSTIRSKNRIEVIGGKDYYFNIGNSAMTYIPLDADGVNRSGSMVYLSESLIDTIPAWAKYLVFYMSRDYGTTYKNDICINLSWSGARNGEYEPYVKHSYPLDSSVILRGVTKLDENGEMYYYGDEYAADGTITRRFAEVDLGTLNYVYSASQGCFSSVRTLTPSAIVQTRGAVNAVCANYPVVNSDSLSLSPDKSMTIYNGSVFIKDSAYTDATTFKAAMSGVMFVYELATPTTETAEPFADPQIVNDWGTEEYVTDSIIPVGHETRYTNNLRDKLQHLPDLAGSDGDYIVRQTGSQMYLIPYGEVKELPDAPGTDGTYRLQLTVSDGTPTLAWVAE